MTRSLFQLPKEYRLYLAKEFPLPPSWKWRFHALKSKTIPFNDDFSFTFPYALSTQTYLTPALLIGSNFLLMALYLLKAYNRQEEVLIAPFIFPEADDFQYELITSIEFQQKILDQTGFSFQSDETDPNERALQFLEEFFSFVGYKLQSSPLIQKMDTGYTYEMKQHLLPNGQACVYAFSYAPEERDIPFWQDKIEQCFQRFVLSHLKRVPFMPYMKAAHTLFAQKIVMSSFLPMFYPPKIREMKIKSWLTYPTPPFVTFGSARELPVTEKEFIKSAYEDLDILSSL